MKPHLQTITHNQNEREKQKLPLQTIQAPESNDYNRNGHHYVYQGQPIQV
jgi:hypothetical protein